jgi:phospholipase/carboxylesterase
MTPASSDLFRTSLFTHRFIPAANPRVPDATGAHGRGPVMLVLPGLGDSLNGYHFLPEALRLPGLSYLMLNAPDVYYGGYSWYDIMNDPAPGILRSRGLLSALIDELIAAGFAARDIYLFGFSQGCLMATDAGLRTPHELGGIVGVSGYVAFPDQYPEAFTPATLNQKFLVTHGRRDQMLPFAPSERQFSALKSLGVDITFTAYEKEHTMLLEELGDIAAWLHDRMSGP